MSLQSIADVIAHVQTHPDVSPTEVLVLLVIANYANQHGANAYPSLATLQKTTHLSRRAIQYGLRGLEDKKLVKTVLVRGRTGRQTYQLLVPHMPLKKGATVAPYEDEKGATHAPFYDGKGATDDTEKAHVLRLELLLTQQGEKRNPTRARDNGCAREDWRDLPDTARRMHVSPDSPLWPLMTTPPDTGKG